MSDSPDIAGIDDAVGRLTDRLEDATEDVETFATATPQGIGIDHIPLARVGRHVAVDQLLKKMTTPRQRRLLFSDDPRAAQVAQLICVKEACAKATGLGFGPELKWTDLAIRSLKKGAIQPVHYRGDGGSWRLLAGSDISHGVAFAVAAAGR